MTKTVDVFTDGSCLGNPGNGGWAAVLKFVDSKGREHSKAISGAKEHTTNNQMEIMAVIQALTILKERCSINLYTDSQYVKNGLEQWLPIWENNHWKTSDKAPVKNKELWQQLRVLQKQHNITIYWVKGHSGHPENEQVDALAKTAAENIGKN